MILVTGGAGYIGSHCVRELKERGIGVVVYDSLVTGHIESVPKDVPFVKGDIFDVELLRETFKKYDVDSVIHFAAFIEVGEYGVQICPKTARSVMNAVRIMPVFNCQEATVQNL